MINFIFLTTLAMSPNNSTIVGFSNGDVGASIQPTTYILKQDIRAELLGVSLDAWTKTYSVPDIEQLGYFSPIRSDYGISAGFEVGQCLFFEATHECDHPTSSLSQAGKNDRLWGSKTELSVTLKLESSLKL